MKDFGIGDIVKFKGYSDVEYYIVTDIIDFTEEGDENPDIECELGQIFPVENNFSLDLINQDKLELLSKFNTKENDMMIDFLIKEREKLGIFGKPIYMDIVENNLGILDLEEEDAPVKEAVKPEKSKNIYPSIAKPRFGEKEIKRILDDTKADEKTNTYSERMNVHLDLLNKAMNDGDEKEVEFQKAQLEKVRNKLMELEYFKMATRMKGVSLRVKNV